jgi:hypothetical protein
MHRTYRHTTCEETTPIPHDWMALTLARDPGFYEELYCLKCDSHFPVAEFTWADGLGEGGEADFWHVLGYAASIKKVGS